MLDHAFVGVIALLLGLIGLISKLYHFVKSRVTPLKIPVSVNYHLTRQCNYSCGTKLKRVIVILFKKLWLIL